MLRRKEARLIFAGGLIYSVTDFAAGGAFFYRQKKKKMMVPAPSAETK
jgi:hypothetical protein